MISIRGIVLGVVEGVAASGALDLEHNGYPKWAFVLVMAALMLSYIDGRYWWSLTRKSRERAWIEMR